MEKTKYHLETRVYMAWEDDLYPGLPCIELVHGMLKQGIAVWCGTASGSHVGAGANRAWFRSKDEAE
ncbi:hypothetical protein [Bordetella genomosp. 4]|uniref:hypothetical protein n=1 Tax=Bordetella genomosp. 4 TaxID=463044 RepID=UPI001177BC23|nr:hypothetical protein [Bordetella genomosp. 4]